MTTHGDKQCHVTAVSGGESGSLNGPASPASGQEAGLLESLLQLQAQQLKATKELTAQIRNLAESNYQVVSTNQQMLAMLTEEMAGEDEDLPSTYLDGSPVL